MNFTEKIIAERIDHDENQRQLANALFTSQAMIWRYENAKCDMTTHVLKAFCHHYQVSADYLLGIPYNYRKPR